MNTDDARLPRIGAAGVVALGVGGLGYAALVERNWFTLRRFTVPVLPAGAGPVRVLQLSDLHLTAGPDAASIEWVRGAGRPRAGPRRQHRRQPGAPRRRARRAARDGAAARAARARSSWGPTTTSRRCRRTRPATSRAGTPRRTAAASRLPIEDLRQGPARRAAGSTSTTRGPRSSVGGHRARAGRRRRPAPAATTGTPRWPGPADAVGGLTIGRDARALPAGAGRDGGRRRRGW